MKVVILGSLDAESVEAMAGHPAIVLTGSIDEVRAAARFLSAGEVEIVSKPAPSEGDPHG